MTENIDKSAHYNDKPIEEPNEDLFDVDPFARALACGIRKMQSPCGTVIALNGPWGSGKSSAANLVRYHLKSAKNSNELVLIDFSCWWFRGEEALALAFFRTLYACLAPSLGAKVKQTLSKLGARLLSAGSIIGGVAEAAGAGGVGSVAGNTMEWLGGLIAQDESVEQLHEELSESLAKSSNRFLIVIDDIDRLSPDEAILMFRLVKSVGRLPNVLYLLVYDRQLAEKIVSERYPAEGPHYLEKIVQATFELPEPSAINLRNILQEQIKHICENAVTTEDHRFMNLFHEGIAPAMRTPRDVVRFTNLLAITWPAVAGEVDAADFLALEVLRLRYPQLYRGIRQNKGLMCLGVQSHNMDSDHVAQFYKDVLFGATPIPDQERLCRFLMRIFPVLETAWDRVTSARIPDQWAQERRACSMAHFDCYFRFTVGGDALSSKEVNELILQAGNKEYIKETIIAGGTKAAILINELLVHADRIELKDVRPLLTALFAVADAINVEQDEFATRQNVQRLIILLRKLLLVRMTLSMRSDILIKACKSSDTSLGWLADLRLCVSSEHDRY